jgi:hypothetical protein
MRNINLGSLRSQERSKRSLLLIGFLCVVFGSLALAVALFMKPEAQRPQFVGKRIRLPIMSVEKEEGPRIPGIVEEEGMEEKPLEGGILEKEKPIVSESPELPMVIQESRVSEKVLILAEQEASDEEKEVTVAEREGKRPEIEGKEEGKSQGCHG